MKSKWYIRKGVYGLPIEVYKVGRYKVVEIHKKDKRFYNLEYTFYKCLVFNKGEVVASEGCLGSSLDKKYKAVRWGMKKAKELGIIPKINY